MRSKIKRLKDELEKVRQRYLLAEKVNYYTSYARHTDLELEKEARQTGLPLDDRIIEELARLGGLLTGLLNAIQIMEDRYV